MYVTSLWSSSCCPNITQCVSQPDELVCFSCSVSLEYQKGKNLFVSCLLSEIWLQAKQCHHTTFSYINCCTDHINQSFVPNYSSFLKPKQGKIKFIILTVLFIVLFFILHINETHSFHYAMLQWVNRSTMFCNVTSWLFPHYAVIFPLNMLFGKAKIFLKIYKKI